MKRVLFFVFGVASHMMFLAVYAWFGCFVANLIVPRSIDSPVAGSLATAIVIDLVLVGLFALQHSGMARPAFKRVWTRLIPPPIERSTYVFISNIVLIVLMLLWQPVPLVVWSVHSTLAWGILTGLQATGWLLVPVVSLMINHFDLFGTRQVWLHLVGRDYEPLPFKTPLMYGWVRHPLYVGWALAFWATPTMTLGHLLFAGLLTAYMVVASKIEERDLVDYFGEVYEDYRSRVPAFLPWPRQTGNTRQLAGTATEAPPVEVS